MGTVTFLVTVSIFTFSPPSLSSSFSLSFSLPPFLPSLSLFLPSSLSLLLLSLLVPSVELPRYVRVNLLKVSMEAVLQRFALDGYTLLERSDTSATSQTSALSDRSSGDKSKAVSFPPVEEKLVETSPSPQAGDVKSRALDQRVRPRPNKRRRQSRKVSVECNSVSSGSRERVETLGCERHYRIDETVPGVLVFPAATCLQNHPLYLSGEILLQDKVTSAASMIV